MSDHPESVLSEVAFVAEVWRSRSELPRIYSGESRRANTVRHEVEIHNARLPHEAGELDLDTSGYVLIDHETAVTDFRDKETVLGEYFPEMKQVILELTGAEDAFPITFYQVRSKDPEHFFDAYSLYMHCDFSPDTLIPFARSILKAEGCVDDYPPDEWDFAFYNLWRPVGGRVEKDPLVLIDARTLERDDIIDYLAVKDDNKGKAAVPLFNPDQRFCYVPEMQQDEVLIFKQLDSREGKALVCPHTSFIDPTAADDARERESIDIRFMCVFPK